MTNDESADLTDFLLELSGLLVAAGDAITDVEHRIRRIARTHGHPDLQIMALPRSIGIAVAPGAIIRLSNIRSPDSGLRLDQIAAVFDLARDAERGQVMPTDGLHRLHDIRRMRHRYTTAAPIIGQTVITIGLALMLSPTLPLLLLQTGLGAIVAALGETVRRLPGLDTLLPLLAGFLVSAIGLSVGPHLGAPGISPLIPALVLLIPGATLTMAVIDLTAGSAVTGTSLFAASFLRLALIAFGIFAGARIVGASPTIRAAAPESPDSWVLWLGLLVFAVGTVLSRSVPMAQTPWLLLVLVAAFAAQRFGEHTAGSTIGGILGGAIAAPLARLAERFRTAPPAFATFLTAFRLLVPGSLGLLSLTQLGQSRTLGSIIAIIDSLITVLSIAVGVLIGLNLQRTATALAHRKTDST